MKFNFKYLLIFFFIALTSVLLPQQQQFLIQKYSVDNGLPDNRINDIVQDSTGRIWVAMKTGIAAYGGVAWKKYGEKDGVPEIEYLRIKIDDKGTIWFLPVFWQNSTIIYFQNSKWQKIKFAESKFVLAGYLNSLDVKYQKSKPEICIGTVSSGIIKFVDNKWTNVTKKDGLLSDTTTKVIFKDDNIYISSLRGLSVIDRNNIIRNYTFTGSNIDPALLDMIDTGTNVPLKNKLLLLGKNWIGEFADEKLKLISKDFNIPFVGINDLNVINFHPSGDIFFGNAAKVFSYNTNTKQVSHVIFDNPSTNKGATSILIDYEGNIWFASLRGIYKCKYSAFHNFYKSDGLLENEVSAISEFNSGELVLGHNYGLTIKSSKGFKHILNGSSETDTRLIRVLDSYHDKNQDVIYYCSYNNGVGKLSVNGNVEWIKSPLANRYFAIFPFNKNNFIVSTEQLLLNLHNNQLSPRSPNIVGMYRKGISINDTCGYLASSNGLHYLDDKSFKHYRNSDPEANNLFTVFYNKKYGVLAGSIKGLYTVQGDSLVKFRFNGQEINESVYFIIEDHSQNIWLGTNNGVLLWNGQNLVRYNKSDGLAGNETNRAAGFVDSKGNVWIGTDEGLSMFTGKELNYSRVKPKLVLLDLEDERNQKFNLASNISLDPDDNTLIFNYRGFSFIDEARNIYQIKLSKNGDEWKDEFLTNYTYSKFNNLLPGDYIFAVRFKNAKGIWSDWKTSSIITINKHYYQQPLFIILSIFLSVFVFYYVYNYVQQKKYTKRLEEAVESRTKMLKEKQSELITSLDRYKGIVDSQTDVVIRVDTQANFTFVNDAFCSVFGKKREEILNTSLFALIHPDDIPLSIEEAKTLENYPFRAKMELRNLTVNGYRWFLWEDYAIYDENKKLKEVQGVGRDITLQKEIESELEKRVRERTIELKSLVSQSPFGILTFNEKGFLIDFNDAADNLFGGLSKYTLPSTSFNIYEDEFLLKNNYRDRLLNLNTSKGLLITNRIFIDDSSDDLYKKLLNRYLIYRIYTVEYEDKSKNLVLLIEDVTDLQKTEEANKKLSEEKIRISTFIKTVESERERISKELHDGIGQLLTAAKLKLDIFRMKTNIDKTEIDEALKILLNAGDEIRRIINDLRPYDIDNFGLVSAIELLCDQIGNASGLNIQYSVANFKSLSDKKRENLTYRIIQEALNNIVKHSKCKNAGVNIYGSDKFLNIEIWDDGIGFYQNLTSQNKNEFGITNMKERTALLGGKITFNTSIQKGVKINLIIPLENND